MASRNGRSKLMGVCHKFLNALSWNSAFGRLQHHILNQSSHSDSRLMPAGHCEGSTTFVAKNAATCNCDPGNEIIVERGIHVVSRNDLYSEIEDEPYLVSHEEASSACNSVKEKPCNKDAELSVQTTLVSAGMANSETELGSHFEENGEPHLKDEEATRSSAINPHSTRSSAINLHSTSQLVDAPSDQSENAGADSLAHDDKGSDSRFTNKVTEAKRREKGHPEMMDWKLEGDGKQQTTKPTKPARPMRRPSAQNDRPSVLIKRRRSTRIAGLAAGSVLL